MTPKTMWVCVYRDTIERHDEDWNLTEVLVTRDFAEQYFNECIASCEDNPYKTFDDFLGEYTADDTEDFYQYAMEHNAVLDKMNW